MTWIKVEDRLPEDGRDVLFIVKSDQGDGFAHGRKLGGRYRSGLAGGFSVPGITFEASHWMPMPDGPGRDEKNRMEKQ